MKIVSVAEMRALEQAAVERGASWAGLMEQAGRGVARLALARLGAPEGRAALVLAGPGNNGGDGLVVARHLHDAGVRVALYLWRRAESADDANLRACRERGIGETAAAADVGQAQLRRLIAASDLVVDGLLGHGASRPAEGDLAAIIAAVNERPARVAVLAIDVPSGTHADHGTILGAAIRADATASTGPIKRGMLHFPARSCAGQLLEVDIGVASEDLEAIMSELITAELARTLLPPRPDDAHKGTFGKVLVVAGSGQYPGAAGLASAGAARVGAGLVTLAAGRSQAFGPGRIPEVTLMLLPEAEWGVLGEAAADEALKGLEGYSALLLGPGIGREKPTRQLVERLLGLDSPRHRGQIGFRIGLSADKPTVKQRPGLPPTVLDADALNILAEIEAERPTAEGPAAHDPWWERLPRGSCVLTPHPGEMGRLTGVEAIDDPQAAAVAAARQWGQIVVLKGATTVVAEPEGRARAYDGANPALATAGTGDVLAGAIAGLLAQGLRPFDAATLGVYLHGAAGRAARDDLGDAGTLASDLLPRLPLAIRALKAR